MTNFTFLFKQTKHIYPPLHIYRQILTIYIKKVHLTFFTSNELDDFLDKLIIMSHACKTVQSALLSHPLHVGNKSIYLPLFPLLSLGHQIPNAPF